MSYIVINTPTSTKPTIMKKLTTIFTLAIFLCSAVIIPSKETSSASSAIDFSRITIEQLIKLTPSQIKEITGEDLNFKEKLVLNLMQKDLKRSVKKNLVDKDTTVDFNQYFEEGKSGLNVGGFILGFLLGLIGVGLAHIFSTDKSFRRSSWQGFGAWVIVLVVLLFV